MSTSIQFVGHLKERFGKIYLLGLVLFIIGQISGITLHHINTSSSSSWWIDVLPLTFVSLPLGAFLILLGKTGELVSSVVGKRLSRGLSITMAS
jgi:drug/metabolite transporter (DMT)-like permease